MSKFDIDTLKDFTKLVDKKNQIYFDHPDQQPGLLAELDEWIDENASDEVIQALGIVHGGDYLHFVPTRVKQKLPIDRLVQTDLYNYQKAQHAVDTGKGYPERMSLRQLHFRSHEVYAAAEREYNLAHHIDDHKVHIIK